MSDVKISALPAVTSVATTDVIPVVTGGVTSKIGSANFVNSGLSGGTANGVLYLNGSKDATSGSALTFDGTNLSSTGGATFIGSPSGFGGGEVRLGPTTAGTQSAISTQSTGTPQLIFDHRGTGNSGMFIWRNGTGGATEQMRLTSTGLGIGTSLPSYKLDVVGTSRSTALITTGTATFGTSGSNAYISLNGNGYIRCDNANYLTFQAGSSGYLWKDSGYSTTQMALDSSGNLGIGTSSPAYNLQVAGSVRANIVIQGKYAGGTDIGHLRYLNANGTQVADVYVSNVNGGASDSANLIFSTTSSGTASDKMRLDSDGTFRVKGAGTAGSTDAVQFSGSAPANSLLLDSSGNLLVGTTSQISTTNGISILPSSAGGYVAIGHATGTPSGNYYSGFYYNGSPIGSIAQNGTTGVLYNITSDQRLKTDLGVATSTAVIDNTIIHDFEWKVDGSKSSGVFAQEAYKVKPEAVSIGNDELNEDGLPVQPWGVDYSKYVPDLIVYCQQLKAELNELKSQLGK